MLSAVCNSQFMEQFGTPDSSPFEVSTIGNECRLKSGTTFSSDKEQADGEFLYAKVADMNLPGTAQIERKFR